jgi:rod shape-determining protein MreB
MFARFSNDLAIDLGTANTLIYHSRKGIVLNEPSIVAINQETGAILAFGTEARKMMGRTPSTIIAVRPLRDGVVADFEIAQKMLRYFLNKAGSKRYISKPTVIVAVPPVVTSVEQRAIKDAAYGAGARKVYVIEEPMAAAIGSGLPVQEPLGSMIVDIGGGTSDIAVISLGGVVSSRSLRVGGDAMDNSIVNYIKNKYHVLIGERTAEELKISIGSAFATHEDGHALIRGRDLRSGLPTEVTVSSEEIREAIEEQISRIIDAIKSTLDVTPPDLVADLVTTGMTIAGGGAMIKGLVQRISRECGMPVRMAEDPLTSVVTGAGICAENMGLLKQVVLPEKR